MLSFSQLALPNDYSTTSQTAIVQSLLPVAIVEPSGEIDMQVSQFLMPLILPDELSPRDVPRPCFAVNTPGNQLSPIGPKDEPKHNQS